MCITTFHSAFWQLYWKVFFFFCEILKEIQKDRGSNEATFHCLKRITFELADLQRRSQLSVVFGMDSLWHPVLLLCRYYVLTVVFQPVLEKAGD